MSTKDIYYTIHCQAGENGQIGPGGYGINSVTVKAGDNQYFAFIPDSGHIKDIVTIDGELLVYSYSYTFSNVQEDHYIVATFKPDPKPEDPDQLPYQYQFLL